jgi:hypothetical protein
MKFDKDLVREILLAVEAHDPPAKLDDSEAGRTRV